MPRFTENLYSTLSLPTATPQETEEERRARNMQNIGYPLMAVAEALLSKGKSPGTAALAAGNQARTYQEGAMERALKKAQSKGDLDLMEAASGLSDEDLSNNEKLQALYRRYKPAEAAKQAHATGSMKWLQQRADIDTYNAMPETTPEEKAAKNARRDQILATYNISGSSLATQSLADREKALRGPKAETAQAVELAKMSPEIQAKAAEGEAQITAAREAAKLRTQQSLAQSGVYDVSGPEASSLVNAADAIDAMKILKEEIAKGANPIDFTGFGVFTNPRARMAYQTIKEYYARPLTGAAVPDAEWSQFESEIGSWQYMATKEGKAAMVDRLGQLERLNLDRGRLVTKADNWYEQLRAPKAPTAPAPGQPTPSKASDKY